MVLQQSAVQREGEPTELCCPFPQDELEHSLGESAAQGAAGVVLWVSWENTKTKVSSGPGRGEGQRSAGETLVHPFRPYSPGWPAGEGLNALGGPMDGHGVPDTPPPQTADRYSAASAQCTACTTTPSGPACGLP